MTTRLFVTLLSIGALAVACGPRPSTSEKSSSAPTKIASSKKGLATTVDVNLANGIRFAVNVTNNGGKKVELLFPNGQTHDLAVLDSTGQEVWRWSSGRMFTQALQTKLLTHGESVRYEEQWENPAPGRYTVVGTLTSESHPMEHRTDFRVGPRQLAAK